jgi:hypothetical protein
VDTRAGRDVGEHERVRADTGVVADVKRRPQPLKHRSSKSRRTCRPDMGTANRRPASGTRNRVWDTLEQ